MLTAQRLDLHYEYNLKLEKTNRESTEIVHICNLANESHMASRSFRE